MFKTPITKGFLYMSYKELYETMNRHIDTNERLIAYSKYYKSLNIRGLYYVYQKKNPFLIAICNPDHTTNSLATSYLLTLYHKKVAPNTLCLKAQALKKFLDFMYLWNFDFNDGDPLPIFYGFADYLRLIPKNSRSTHANLWALKTEVPLNETAMSLGKIVTIGPIENLYKLERKEWAEHSYETIERSLETAIEFYEWLQQRTQKYRNLPIRQIPKKEVRRKSFISATSGESYIQITAVRAILAQIGLIPSSTKQIKPFKQSKLILPEQADWFISTLESPQDKLLFVLLRYFGIRRSEAANLKIDPLSIPDLKNPLYAKHALKENLSGNLKWDFSCGRGFWSVQINSSKTISGRRTIPFLAEWKIEQDWLTHLLYDALFERQSLIRKNFEHPNDHGYLFVSKHHAYVGQPISGETILKKFNYLAEKLNNKDNFKFDLTNDYSPHSFRHLFATLLIMLNPQDETRISILMGHSSVDITKKIYFHIYENAKNQSNKSNNTLKDMLEVYKSLSITSNQSFKEYIEDDEDI